MRTNYNRKPFPRNPYLPNNLKIAREKAGLKRSTVARQLGLFVWQIERFERGAMEPRLETLVKLAQVLQVDDLYLFLTKNIE